MSKLEVLLKNIILLLTTYLVTNILKCANTNQVNKSHSSIKRRPKKRRSANEYIKMTQEADKGLASVSLDGENFKSDQLVDLEIKKFNQTVGKGIYHSVNPRDRRNVPKSTKTAILNQVNLLDKKKYVSCSEKKESSKNRVHQVDDPNIQTCFINKRESSIDPKTESISKFADKDCKSLLGMPTNELKQSSIRSGDGNYKSLTLSPISLQSPFQIPNFPELENAFEENGSDKKNGSEKRKHNNDEYQKSVNTHKIENTQSISTATRGILKSKYDTIEEILRGNIFDKTNPRKIDDINEESNQKVKETECGTTTAKANVLEVNSVKLKAEKSNKCV